MFLVLQILLDFEVIRLDIQGAEGSTSFKRIELQNSSQRSEIHIWNNFIHSSALFPTELNPNRKVMAKRYMCVTKGFN